jgi:hypothetical protein
MKSYAEGIPSGKDMPKAFLWEKLKVAIPAFSL